MQILLSNCIDQSLHFLYMHLFQNCHVFPYIIYSLSFMYVCLFIYLSIHSDLKFLLFVMYCVDNGSYHSHVSISKWIFYWMFIAVYHILSTFLGYVRCMSGNRSKGVDWFHLVQDRDQHWATLNTGMNLQVPENGVKWL
jgi:hypothetical protein